MIYNFFDKKTSGGGIKNGNISNKELAEEFYKPIIRKLNKRKVRSSLIDSFWRTDPADKELISKFNQRICFFLCVIDIYSK